LYAYDLHELRFAQTRQVTSAANSLVVNCHVVPANKLWTILAGRYFPDASETRTVSVSKETMGGTLPIRIPASIALSISVFYPIVTEGNQVVLLPGEYLKVERDVATAGSTMTLTIQIVESDLPTMKYHDPQKLLSQDRRKRGFASASILGSTAAAMGGHAGEGGEGGGGGGEGGAIPV